MLWRFKTRVRRLSARLLGPKEVEKLACIGTLITSFEVLSRICLLLKLCIGVVDKGSSFFHKIL